ncbi:hypothetical protein PC114_g7962 [Phytophthora cactorum]|nr:hypothetical protein PC114_g7962 [Phytophthora cactorum]
MALAVTTTTAATLFSVLTLGGKENRVQLKHRVVMAPLTRVRSGDSGVPSDVVKLYYSQRATDGGLQITEATNISATARGYFGAPGLFRQDQVEGWKAVTEAVHAKGGKIFAQLWHTGRVGHPLNQPDGQLPVSSSATSFDGVKSHAVTSEGRKDYVTPRALDISEIPGIVADYKLAAENAITAGFDGVEVHAGNGYLLEQFLCDGVNKRFDRVDAIRAVEDGTTDLVAFGRYFISNPDLVERLRTDADLNAFDSNTFYVQPDMTVEAGYTDYPFLGEEVRSA